MRVVFFGTPAFAVPALHALIAAGHTLVGVVAQPSKPAGRGQELTAPPVAQRANELDLPLLQPKAIKTGAFSEQLRIWSPDVAVVVAYGRILTREILEIPKFGCINVHASLLPRWRGAAPIQWSIWAGDTETGVCTQQMAEGLDTGPVFLQRCTPINSRETASQLHDRLSLLGAEVIVETLAGLGQISPTLQQESLATYAGKIDKDMGRIDLSRSAMDIDRQIRAMTTWPGGFLPLKEGSLKILEAVPVDMETAGAVPGEILSVRPLIIACGTQALELIRVQAPGRKPVSGAEYANGARCVVGQNWMFHE